MIHHPPWALESTLIEMLFSRGRERVREFRQGTASQAGWSKQTSNLFFRLTCGIWTIQTCLRWTVQIWSSNSWSNHASIYLHKIRNLDLYRSLSTMTCDADSREVAVDRQLMCTYSIVRSFALRKLFVNRQIFCLTKKNRGWTTVEVRYFGDVFQHSRHR
jgi:hypothetical protein